LFIHFGQESILARFFFEGRIGAEAIVGASGITEFGFHLRIIRPCQWQPPISKA
jgi:hypothetical protein